MARFTTDNTEGYSAADLAELNAIFDELVAQNAAYAPLVHEDGVGDTYAKSTLDYLAERAEIAFHERHAQ